MPPKGQQRKAKRGSKSTTEGVSESSNAAGTSRSEVAEDVVLLPAGITMIIPADEPEARIPAAPAQEDVAEPQVLATPEPLPEEPFVEPIIVSPPRFIDLNLEQLEKIIKGAEKDIDPEVLIDIREVTFKVQTLPELLQQLQQRHPQFFFSNPLYLQSLENKEESLNKMREEMVSSALNKYFRNNQDRYVEVVQSIFQLNDANDLIRLYEANQESLREFSFLISEENIQLTKNIATKKFLNDLIKKVGLSLIPNYFGNVDFMQQHDYMTSFKELISQESDIDIFVDFKRTVAGFMGIHPKCLKVLDGIIQATDVKQKLIKSYEKLMKIRRNIFRDRCLLLSDISKMTAENIQLLESITLPQVDQRKLFECLRDGVAARLGITDFEYFFSTVDDREYQYMLEELRQAFTQLKENRQELIIKISRRYRSFIDGAQEASRQLIHREITAVQCGQKFFQIACDRQVNLAHEHLVELVDEKECEFLQNQLRYRQLLFILEQKINGKLAKREDAGRESKIAVLRDFAIRLESASSMESLLGIVDFDLRNSWKKKVLLHVNKEVAKQIVAELGLDLNQLVKNKTNIAEYKLVYEKHIGEISTVTRTRLSQCRNALLSSSVSSSFVVPGQPSYQ